MLHSARVVFLNENNSKVSLMIECPPMHFLANAGDGGELGFALRCCCGRMRESPFHPGRGAMAKSGDPLRCNEIEI